MLNKTMPQSSEAPIARPKRGRRRKRPELTEEQRKALRAYQNREATRRSRERTRRRAEDLKSALEVSRLEKQELQAERDRLLAAVGHASGGGVAGTASVEKVKEGGMEGIVCSSTSLTRGDVVRKQNPMSLAVILNDEDGEGGGLFSFMSPSKQVCNERSTCETSPISIVSLDSTRAVVQRGLQSFM